jgi:TonB family protein
MSSIRVHPIALLLAAGLAGPAAAQSTATATVTGHVRDVRNQPIAGATVMLVDTWTGTLTSRDGEYTIVSTPATVSLLVTARGYKPFQLTGLRLLANRSIEQDWQLADSLPRQLPYPGFFTSEQVDDPVQYIGAPLPRYPDSLKAARIEGRVILRYIVGTDGRVEGGSVQVLSSTRKEFEEPAIEAIRQSTFRPAKLKGVAVRQMVEQVVRFTLK